MAEPRCPVVGKGYPEDSMRCVAVCETQAEHSPAACWSGMCVCVGTLLQSQQETGALPIQGRGLARGAGWDRPGNVGVWQDLACEAGQARCTAP